MAVQIRAVHPLADLFPMLSKPELEVLADDIKANGLREPIQVTDDGILIEGRNRLAACELAGVEPTFETVNGDIGARIVSANIMRRHLSKGQIAILAVYAERGLDLPDKEVRATRSDDSAPRRKNYDYAAQTHKRVRNLVSVDMVARADLIVEWASDLAQEILETPGGGGFMAAHETAKARKNAMSSEDKRREILAEDSPDLLALVSDDGGITIAEAWKTREDRRAQEQADKTRLNSYLVMALRPMLGKSDQGIKDIVDKYDPKLAEEYGVAQVEEASDYLKRLRAEFKRQKKG